MRLLRQYAILGLAAWCAAGAANGAQPSNLRVGYVYPAGGKQGSTFEAVIAGQFLADVNQVLVSGGGVRATIAELIRPISPRELNALRIQVDELLARKAVVTKDFRALERFRSFKNAKTVKKEPGADEDRELEELKKKYAHATWTAADERMLMEARKKMSTSVRRPENPAISELVVVQMSVAEDAEPGPRELRIATPTAMSNPLVFHVGQLPEYSEPASKVISEQRSVVAKTAAAPRARDAKEATRITLPAVVNGQILPGTVDRFRFTASKGQRLVVAASARQLIPYIADAVPGWFQATLALYDARGKELAYADDYRFHPDPVLFCSIPADGEYEVEIKDAIYRGREDFVYRMAIGELPFLTGIFPLGGPAGAETAVELHGWNLPSKRLTVDNRHRVAGVYPVSLRAGDRMSNAVPFRVDTLPEALEHEPNDGPLSAQQVTAPLIVNGRIEHPEDRDVFVFEGHAGQQVVAEVHARRLDSPLDSVLRLSDASGREVAMNNDYEDKAAGLLTHHADSYLQATLPANGRYYLRIEDGQHQGEPDYGYRLRISPPRPDFDLRIVPSSVTARGGSSVPLTVYAVRRDGFSGEIALALKGAPQGCALSGGRIPSGQDQVRVTLTIPPSPSEEFFRLSLEGRATIAGREVSHPVVPADELMQAFAYRHLVPAQELVVAVSGGTPLRSVPSIVGQLPLQIPAGGTARVGIALAPQAMMKQLRLELSEPPEGIEIQGISPSGRGLDIVFRADAAKVKPGLQGNLILAASGRNLGAAGKGKAKMNPRNSPRIVLPAIPFEVTGR